MTRFQLILPVHVKKNLTGHRMHVKGPQIYQINRQTNSFQYMCEMLQTKIVRLARKIDFVQKNTSKLPFLVDTNLALDAKRLSPGQLLAYPWKVWGITDQTSYWEGQLHQNWVCSRPAKKSRLRPRKFVKNWIFLLFGLQLENEERYRDGSNGWNDAYI